MMLRFRLPEALPPWRMATARLKRRDPARVARWIGERRYGVPGSWRHASRRMIGRRPQQSFERLTSVAARRIIRLCHDTTA